MPRQRRRPAQNPSPARDDERIEQLFRDAMRDLEELKRPPRHQAPD